MVPSRWTTPPSAMTWASVRLRTFVTTYLPRISVVAMARSPWNSLDASVEHLHEFLLLEGAGHLGAQSLYEVGSIALEFGTDHAPWSCHVDRHAVEHAAGSRGEDDHAIREVHGFVDVVCHEDHRLAGALPNVEQ